MKMQYFLTSIILIMLSAAAYSMDYGLRFNAHEVPGSQRTTLTLGEGEPFSFSRQLNLEFDMAFYATPHFGQICTINLDNGTTIYIVSSVKNTDNYNPALIINDKVFYIPFDFVADQSRPAKIGLTLDKEKNLINFRYNNEFISHPTDLSKAKSAHITFGSTQNQPAVAPLDIKDIRLFLDNRNTHHWELAKHGEGVTFDCISSMPAIVNNPRWIIDDHFNWKKILEFKTGSHIQTAFDPATSNFYILSEDKLSIFNPSTGKKTDKAVSSDQRVMKYSNHLAFDSLSNSLISYNLKQLSASKLDLNTLSWTGSQKNDDESFFQNHSFASDGKIAFVFGGYGFYLYNNNAFKINLQSGEISPVQLKPLPQPRTSSSSAIVADKLYIFGGTGNAAGKQEIPAEYYYDLWEYDINSLEGKKVWELKDVEMNFVPSSSMYFNKKENAFYMASTLHGGNMIKISLDKPGFEIVSENIFSKMDYRDCVFDLYKSGSDNSFYLVMDKRLSDSSHDYALYSIIYPFADNVSYQNLGGNQKNDDDNSSLSSSSGKVALIAIIAIITIVACFIIFRKKVGSYLHTRLSKDKGKDISGLESSLNKPEEIFSTAESRQHFNREKSAISLLGEFNVRDRNGKDVTSDFSSRLKDLLILLILENARSQKGVKQQLIDEIIWNDRDEKSAKNNRNVYMRKLRLLLADIGDFEIIFDKGYYLVSNNDVLVDYSEIMNRIDLLEKNSKADHEMIEEILELLLYGPLLPDTDYPWLDSFKSNYSDKSVEILFKLLKYLSVSNHKDDNLTYRVAQTISDHDPLCEEALEIKCRILTERKMKSLAKKTYERFCNEYENRLNQKFPRSFSDLR